MKKKSLTVAFRHNHHDNISTKKLIISVTNACISCERCNSLFDTSFLLTIHKSLVVFCTQSLLL